MTYPQPVSRALWNQVLSYARKYDVEEGETNEYIYAVRQTTGTITIWTRTGWTEGWYVARVTPEKWTDPRKKKLKLLLIPGDCPPAQTWDDDKLITHVAGLLGRAEIGNAK